MQTLFTDDQLRSFVSIEIVVVGIATLLQSLKTRFSSGHLMIHAPNLMSIAALGAIVLNFGLGRPQALISSRVLSLLFWPASCRDFRSSFRRRLRESCWCFSA